MEMNPAINVAQNLQNRVGVTLGSLQMLTNTESQAAILGAGATSIGTAVLTSIKAGQDLLLASTDKVVKLLTTQVEIQEEKQRREREALAELDKEKKGSTLPITDGEGKGKFKLNKDGLLEGLDVGDLASLAVAGGLLFKSVAGKIIKGGGKMGFYGLLATFLAKPAIDFIEDGILKIDIPEEEEKKLADAITAAAVGMVAGLPGVLAALGVVGVNSLMKYFNGEIDKLSATDAATLFAGGIGVKLLGAKAVSALTAAGWVKSAGILGAITATPVILAVGVGIAMGIAVNELVKFNESVQEQTLKELEEITKISQAELSKRFAEQKEGFVENFIGAGMGDLLGLDISDLSKARIGTEQALDSFKKDPEEFDATEQQSVLKSLDGIMLASSDDLEKILSDRTKTTAVLDTLNAARQLAVSGAFGEEKSKKLLTQLLKFSSNLQVAAKTTIAKNDGKGNSLTTALAEGEGDLLELFKTKFIGAQDTVSENTKLINIADKEIKRLENKDELTDEEDDKLTRLVRERNILAQEIMRAKTDMKRFSSSGLFGEGGLGFDANKLQSIYSDDELANLIKAALKNELFKIVNQNIDETAKSEKSNSIEVKTGVSSNKTNVSNEMHIGPPSHTVDQHLQGST